ncbi:MAG TPA: hypothetical protein IAA95_05630 [Candidatus Aveggerthella excrementigallinarum]|nr:hypothetical protein [Candidatus Aveggerthella excrementigallinarum]
MFRKVIITIAVFLLVGLCVFGVGAVADPDVGAPQAIVPESACPVVGCASGECHAWDSLTDRYHQASDASLNLWILAPVVLVVGLVLLVKKVR